MKHIGHGTHIDDTAVIEADNFYIGDHCHIGPGVKIMADVFCMGDYSKIHDRVWVYTQNHMFPGGAVLLGHNAWVGQDSIIDGTGRFVTGDNFAGGMCAQFYTHISNGDELEGCNYHDASPTIIGDDVWFVGFCLSGPVKAGDKSMALLGSVVTRDMDANRIYGGNPTRDLTDKLGAPYTPVPADEKLRKMLELKRRFFGIRTELGGNSISVVNDPDFDFDRTGATVFNVATRTYSKHGTEAEVAFMKHLVSYKARFTPHDQCIPDIHAALESDENL